jgi:hypothetical protein
MQIAARIRTGLGMGILLLLLNACGCYESRGHRFTDDAAQERLEIVSDETREVIVEEGPVEAIPDILADDTLEDATDHFEVSPTVWARTFLDAAGFYASIETVPEGGYVVAAEASSCWPEDPDCNHAVFRLTDEGELVWQKERASESTTKWTGITQSGDGGFLLSGYETYYPWQISDLMKIDTGGNGLWRKEGIGQFVKGISGGIVAAGSEAEYPYQSIDFRVVRLDTDGRPSWDHRFRYGTTDIAGSLQAVACLPEGDCVFAGEAGDYAVGNANAWVAWIDANGDSRWFKIYGGPQSDMGADIIPTGDGGFVVGGKTQSFGAGFDDALLFKITAGGTVLWQRAYGGPEGSEWIVSVEETYDGGLVAAGGEDSFGAGRNNVWLLRLDGGGRVLWQRTYGLEGYSAWALDVKQASDGGFAVLAEKTAQGGAPWQLWVLKVDADGLISEDCPQGYGPSSSALTTDISMEVVWHTLSQTDVTEGLTDLDPSLVTADLAPVMECGG